MLDENNLNTIDTNRFGLYTTFSSY